MRESGCARVRGTSLPTIPLPPNAWDTHAHVFGPFDSYPLAPDCRYQPPFASQEMHLEMLDVAGFARGILVHASANGFDNSGVLNAAKCSPSRIRAVGVLPEETSDETLMKLHEAGMRGLRFTETGDQIGSQKPSGVLGFDALKRLAPRLRRLGWHALIWAKCQFLVESQDWLSACGIPLVLDHMGAFDVTRGVEDATFQSFLGMLDNGATWVKLVPLRVSKLPWNDCRDVRPFHDALIEKAPDRMLWGSDWPYIAMDKDLPDVGRQIDLFDSWTPDTALRERIFVTNPKALYRYE